MNSPPDASPQAPRRRRFRHWPWLLLAALTLPAFWHAFVFPRELDDEFPAVVRPTFSPYPPPAIRLAEPGDTIDRVGIYVSSIAVVLSITGLVRAGSGGNRPLWTAAVAASSAAFWGAANPGPTFDGWHGLGWASVANPGTPWGLRAALAAAALGLAAVVVRGVGLRLSGWRDLWREGEERGTSRLVAAAVVLTIARGVDVPGLGPMGYWPRWAFAWGVVAFCAALVRAIPAPARPGGRPARLGRFGVGAVAWFGLVVAGVWLTWYHRPLERLREVVPGKIFVCAMPTARGLEVAHARHRFKTIINLFPEDSPLRSPRLPDELRFARSHGVRYVGSPTEVSGSNDFLDLTLRLARDPDAWPVLVHCHACMDRTPAWVGIYRYVVEGRPLDEVFRFIEGHRGSRPKASVTLLYNRVLPRLAPERYRVDPTAALLARCAAGTVDPYVEQLRAEQAGVNRGAAAGVREATGTASAVHLPNLTPRR